jgi:DNA modification methylase
MTVKNKNSNNKVLMGDCLELMKKITSGSIDMILCDLPYGTTVCKWDIIIPFEPLWEQYKRITKPNGAIVLFGCEPFSSYLRMSNINNYKYDWKWIKNRPTGTMLAKRQPMRNTEDIMVFYKSQCTYNRQMIKKTDQEFKASYRKNNSESRNGEQRRNSRNPLIRQSKERQWYKPPVTTLNFKLDDKRDGTQHPTQKPLALIEYLVKTYSNEGDLILDNCAGSGTTAIACLSTKRQFIVMEKEWNYFDMIKKRVSDFNKR